MTNIVNNINKTAIHEFIYNDMLPYIDYNSEDAYFNAIIHFTNIMNSGDINTFIATIYNLGYMASRHIRHNNIFDKIMNIISFVDKSLLIENHNLPFDFLYQNYKRLVDLYYRVLGQEKIIIDIIKMIDHVFNEFKVDYTNNIYDQSRALPGMNPTDKSLIKSASNVLYKVKSTCNKEIKSTSLYHNITESDVEAMKTENSCESLLNKIDEIDKILDLIMKNGINYIGIKDKVYVILKIERIIEIMKFKLCDSIRKQIFTMYNKSISSLILPFLYCPPMIQRLIDAGYITKDIYTINIQLHSYTMNSFIPLDLVNSETINEQQTIINGTFYNSNITHKGITYNIHNVIRTYIMFGDLNDEYLNEIVNNEKVQFQLEGMQDCNIDIIRDGECDDPLLCLIRNDDINGFINYIIQMNINVQTKKYSTMRYEQRPNYANDILKSIGFTEMKKQFPQLIEQIEDVDFARYETNIDLYTELTVAEIDYKNPRMHYHEFNLIEYAAFYGALQIFKFLFSNMDLTHQNVIILVCYIIHGNNNEMFHYLEDYMKNFLKNDDIYTFFIYAITCYNFDLARYILDNYARDEYGIHYYLYSEISASNFVLTHDDYSEYYDE